MDTIEQTITKAELRYHIEGLVRLVTKHKLCVAGFVWGTEPLTIIRFGNIKEEGPAMARMFLELEDLAEDRTAAGMVIRNKISETEPEKQ